MNFSFTLHHPGDQTESADPQSITLLAYLVGMPTHGQASRQTLINTFYEALAQTDTNKGIKIEVNVLAPGDSGMRDDTWRSFADATNAVDPNKRPQLLSDSSKRLNGQVNLQCHNFPQDYIEQVVAYSTSLKPDQQLEITEAALHKTFEVAFAETVKQIEADPELRDYFNSGLKPELTYSDSIGELVTENAGLVPFLMTGAIKKIVSETGKPVSECLEIFLQIPEEQLNDCLFGLRIGVNGALQGTGSLPPEELYIFGYDEHGVPSLQLDQDVLRRKANEVARQNRARNNMLEALGAFADIAQERGLKMYFMPKSLGFGAARAGICPVALNVLARQRPYSAQVALARRVVEEVLKNFVENNI